MIIILEEEVADLELTEQAVVVIETYDFDLPSGITNNSFTQKGSILVGLGAGTFVEFPPGADGEYLKFDSGETAGVTSEIPTIAVNDQTNHLINGGFDLAQGQTPGTLTTVADGGYGADQWKMTRENADLQYVRQDGSGESGLTSRYYGQFKKITNAGKLLICQPLLNRDTLKFRGSSLSFQMQMKASSAKTMKIAVVELQAAGTADTLPTLVSAWNADGTDPTLGANLAVIGTPVSCSVTTAWQTFQFTGALPANSKNIMVMVWSNADFAADDTVSLAEAGLYFGTTLRTWTPRPFVLEIALAQQFYEKSYDLDTLPGAAATYTGSHFFVAASTKFDESIRFQTRKRSAPTLTVYSPSTGNSDAVRNLTTPGELTTIDESGSGETFGLFYKASGVTDGSEYAFQWTANARL